MEFIRRHKNLLAISGIALFMLVFFCNTFLLQQPISKVYLLADRDLLFSQFRSPADHFDWDESLFLLKIPNFFTVGQFWRGGNLPLWNPYVGLGFPLIGDLQSCVFSPWRILGSLCPTIGFYNHGLLAQLAFGSVGCFLLSRFLRLSVFSSIFVALVFILSPYQLTYLELLAGPTFTLYPWLFLAFARAAEKGSLLKLTVAGLSTALIIFTGHALVAFAGILAACVLFFLLSVFHYHRTESRITSVRSGVLGIAAIGILSACFAAPVLFPFVEYVKGSACYKFEQNQEVLSWTTMPYFLMHPGVGAQSPWLGILALPLIAAAFFLKDERQGIYRCIAAAIVLIFPVMCSLGPVAFITNLTPLQLVPGVYYTFSVLLLISIGAGFGLDALKNNALQSNRCVVAIAAVLALALALPQVLNICHADLSCTSFSALIPTAQLRTKIWLIDLCISLAFVVVAAAQRYGKITPRSLSLAALALCLTSELLVSRQALPVRPKFDFILTPAHKILRDTGERVGPMGFDVLAANTNAIYGIRSLAMHNPMFHKRFVQLMSASKVHVDHFNILPENLEQSKMLDLFSVAYLIGLSPAISADAVLNKDTTIKVSAPVMFENGITLNSSEVAVNFQNREAMGKLNWYIAGLSEMALKNAKAERERFITKKAYNAADLAEKAKRQRFNRRYRFVSIVSDAKGTPIWFSGTTSILGRPRLLNFTAILPVSLTANQEFRVGVKVFDSEKGAFVRLKNVEGADAEVYTLGTWTMPAGTPEDQGAVKNRFELVSDLGNDHIRIYKNKTALPQAYLVGRILPVKTGDDALAQISKPDFPARRIAAVEIDNKSWQPCDSDFCRIFQKVEQLDSDQQKLCEQLAVNGSSLTEEALPKVERVSPNQVRITCSTSKDALLVFTDFFYPGWKAKVDGKDTPILCANYAMRGVGLTKGQHVVEFSYQPLSFYLGSALAIGSLSVLFLIFVLKKKRGSV